jgi:quercetin dioxygenase-like cupin family protein
VGVQSSADAISVRHSGSEYGHVLAGRLGVTVGLKTYELGPRDSISLESTRPHRLFNAGDEPMEAVWFVVGRRGDPRISGPLLARTADRPHA